MIQRQSLSTSERLKSYRKIRLLFAGGKKFKLFPLVVYYVMRKVEEVEGGLERLREVDSVEEVEVVEGKLREVDPVEEVEGVEVVEGKFREIDPVEEVEGVEVVEGKLREENSVEGVEGVEVVEGDVERLKGGDGVLQMGVSVGKRHFKRAVDRNLIKRRIREAYRKQKLELKETLMASGSSMDVFFVYANARISDYAEIETAMASALAVLTDKVKIRTPRTD